MGKGKEGTSQSRQKKLAAFRFPGFRKSRENFISAPSFFLSALKRMLQSGWGTNLSSSPWEGGPIKQRNMGIASYGIAPAERTQKNSENRGNKDTRPASYK